MRLWNCWVATMALNLYPNAQLSMPLFLGMYKCCHWRSTRAVTLVFLVSLVCFKIRQNASVHEEGPWIYRGNFRTRPRLFSCSASKKADRPVCRARAFQWDNSTHQEGKAGHFHLLDKLISYLICNTNVIFGHNFIECKK